MTIGFLGMGINLGCDTDGVEEAPQLLRTQLSAKMGGKIEDRGDIQLPLRNHFPDKYAWDKRIKYAGPIATCSEALAKAVCNLLTESKFPFVCGGDHVEALGTLMGVSTFYGKEELGVVYIDAHGDFNTEESSPSHNAHGMHMAALMGIGENLFTKKSKQSPYLKPGNIYFFGTRSLDPGEKQLAKEQHLNIYSPRYLRKIGLREQLDRVYQDMVAKQIKQVHISFDVDAIDPVYAPGTGVKEPNGLTPEEVKEILLYFIKKRNVCSMDFVELNNALDPTGGTAKLTLGLLADIMEQLEQ